MINDYLFISLFEIFIYLSIWFFDFIYLFVWNMYWFIYLFIRLKYSFVYLLMYLFIYFEIFIYLPTYYLIHLFIWNLYLSIYLFIYLYIYSVPLMTLMGLPLQPLLGDAFNFLFHFLPNPWWRRIPILPMFEAGHDCCAIVLFWKRVV